MKLVFAGLLGLGLVAPVVEQAAQPRSALGYVSLQRILNESLNAKAGAKRLEELRQAKAKDIAAKQKALEATRLEVANAGGVFSVSKRARLKALEEQQQKEIVDATQHAQTDFQNMQREVQIELRRELNGVVADLARRKAIQLVLNQDNVVLWASTGTDLTTEVLERMNAAAQKPTAK